MVELERICYDFVQDMYKCNDISENALRQVIVDFPRTFLLAMNSILMHYVVKV